MLEKKSRGMQLDSRSGSLSAVLNGLEDLSLCGCYRLTDAGVIHIASPTLRRFNYCGCYKVTEAGRRYLLTCNPSQIGRASCRERV